MLSIYINKKTMPALQNKYTEFVNELANKKFESGSIHYRLANNKSYFSSLENIQFVIKREYKKDDKEFIKFLLECDKKYNLKKHFRKYRFGLSSINEKHYEDGKGLTMIEL